MDEMVIAGIGEVLWDVIGDVEKLGGAPINFAFHASELGAKGLAVSTVGDDQRGKSALQVLQANGVDIEHVTV